MLWKKQGRAYKLIWIFRNICSDGESKRWKANRKLKDFGINYFFNVLYVCESSKDVPISVALNPDKESLKNKPLPCSSQKLKSFDLTLRRNYSIAKDVAIVLPFTVHDHSMANRLFFRVDVRDSFFSNLPTRESEKTFDRSNSRRWKRSIYVNGKMRSYLWINKKLTYYLNEKGRFNKDPFWDQNKDPKFLPIALSFLSSLHTHCVISWSYSSFNNVSTM